jgi:hypothetical protein
MKKINWKIVYVLGAGFSAYADLPVMSNFIDKAKDIYFSDCTNNEDRKVLQGTFKLINSYAIIKEKMNSNLSNIEELLSIYEMVCFANKKSSNQIKNFIKFVITYYEDIFAKSTSMYYENNLNSSFVIENALAYSYFVWLYSMSGNNKLDQILRFDPDYHSKIDKVGANIYKYDIISLNYDTLLEITTDKAKNGLNITIPLDKENIKYNTIRYCKLHGSIDNNTIVPPTWAKLNMKQVVNDWSDAYKLLVNANEIRIIGFSFPETDNHLKYLFKSAIIENQNLRKIDILCLDTDNVVEKRYKSMFSTNILRFRNENIAKYFEIINKYYEKNIDSYQYNDIELAHDEIFTA